MRTRSPSPRRPSKQLQELGVAICPRHGGAPASSTLCGLQMLQEIRSFKSFAAPAVVARQVLVCAVVQKHRHNPDLRVPRYGSEHQKCVRPSCRTSKPSKAASISQFPATASCQLRTEKNITISCQLTGVEAYGHTFPAAATSPQPSCRLQRCHR